MKAQKDSNPSYPQDLPYVDLPGLSECFADHIRITHFDGMLFHIEFAVSRPKYVGPNETSTETYPAARLILTANAAGSLRDQLTRMFDQLEQGDFLKRVAPSPETKQ